MPRLIVILGMKGSGKSSLGRSLADRLGLGFLDLDGLLAARVGQPSAREAYLQLGEGGFRALESELLGELLGPAGESKLRNAALVLSTGGGLAEAPGALALLAASRREGRALLLRLEAPPELLFRRLEAAASLPAWLGPRPDPAAFALVQEAREAAYRALEPLALDAALPPAELLAAALSRLYADPNFAILVRDPGGGAPTADPEKEIS